MQQNEEEDQKWNGWRVDMGDVRVASLVWFTVQGGAQAASEHSLF